MFAHLSTMVWARGLPISPRRLSHNGWLGCAGDVGMRRFCSGLSTSRSYNQSFDSYNRLGCSYDAWFDSYRKMQCKVSWPINSIHTAPPVIHISTFEIHIIIDFIHIINSNRNPALAAKSLKARTEGLKGVTKRCDHTLRHLLPLRQHWS